MLNTDIKRNNLAVAQTFGILGPWSNNEQTDADFSLVATGNQFLRFNFLNTKFNKQKNQSKKSTKLIFDFLNNSSFNIFKEEIDCNLYNYLTYTIISKFLPLITEKVEIYICNTDSKYNYLYENCKFITMSKTKKMKGAVLITPYHPILNVINIKDYSNYFNKVFNPLMRLSLSQILKIQEFYIDKDNELYKNVMQDQRGACLGAAPLSQKFDFLYNFWYNDYGDKELTDEKMKSLDLQIVEPQTNIYEFELSGTEKDFSLFDKILKIYEKDLKEGTSSLILYKVNNKEAANFIINNLKPYVSPFHAPNKFNIRIGNEEQIFTPNEFYSSQEVVK